MCLLGAIATADMSDLNFLLPPTERQETSDRDVGEHSLAELRWPAELPAVRAPSSHDPLRGPLTSTFDHLDFAANLSRNHVPAIISPTSEGVNWFALGFLEALECGKMRVMTTEFTPGKPTTRRYTKEEKDQAVRLVFELRTELGTTCRVSRLLRQS